MEVREIFPGLGDVVRRDSVLELAEATRARQSRPDSSVALCRKSPLDPDWILTKDETCLSFVLMY